MGLRGEARLTSNPQVTGSIPAGHTIYLQGFLRHRSDSQLPPVAPGFVIAFIMIVPCAYLVTPSQMGSVMTRCSIGLDSSFSR